jgi:hypothetical protein
MSAKGNAENVYFPLDNDKYFIGVNHSNAQIIEVYFENTEPAKVVFKNQLIGKMTPLNKTPKEELIIKGFKWQESLRPKSKYELMKLPSLNRP